MIRENTVFGPIHSRRLGNSLGINLLPENGKICNFDCIYCECGWNADGRGDNHIPSAEEVRSKLESKLKSCVADGVRIDSITFSGDGEPTLNPDFPEIIADTISLRDKYYPDAKVSVLSNSTRAHIPEVFEALRKVDNPIMKLDAPSNDLAAIINRPCSDYDVNKVVDALSHFEGNFILQVMFLRGEEFDSTSAEQYEPMIDIIRRLHPRLTMAYTIDRPTPAGNLQKVSVEEMGKIMAPLVAEGYDIQFKG